MSPEDPVWRERRRASDRLATFAVIVAVLAVVINAGTSFIGVRNTASIEDFEQARLATNREGRERRDQTCKLFEGEHLKDVQRLRRTYLYLTSLTKEQLREPLNRFVLASLPETEREARTDGAPEYCDVKDVGLPEPDPVIPPRPKALEGVATPP